MTKKSHLVAADKPKRKAIVAIEDTIRADIMSKVLTIAGFERVVMVDSMDCVLGELDLVADPVDLIVAQLILRDGDGFALIEDLAVRRYAGVLMFTSEASPVLLSCATNLAQLRDVRLMESHHPRCSLKALLSSIQHEWQHGDSPKNPAHTQSPPPFDAAKDFNRASFEAVYQPKVCLRTAAVVGYEALARWKHPTLGLLPAACFLGSIEEHHLIGELTEEIVRQSAATLSRLTALTPRATMSVNLSASMLGTRDLPGQMYDLVQGLQAKPSQFTFEITEDEELRDCSLSLVNVSRLGLMGFGLSLDDFGTGYSSLSRLKSIPFTELKIDRQFCHGSSGCPQLAHIVKSCVELAGDLGLRTVAEGVETDSDRELVASMGVDAVQGFCECPALTSDSLLSWLQRREDSGQELVA